MKCVFEQNNTDLFELEFDGFDELCRDEFGCLGPELHRFGHCRDAELTHHRIRVSVDHLQTRRLFNSIQTPLLLPLVVT